MDADLKSKLEHCLGEHAAPLSLPPETYRDDQVVEEEIATIFRRLYLLGLCQTVDHFIA